jgi:radical SAM superfamily enzyme YgiQ (UPF0313 family)
VKLLLTHGYFLENDVKEQKIMKPYAPLGLLYLSSHLRAKGYDVGIYDSTFGSMAELRSQLGEGEPGVLGIYGNLMTRPSVLALVAEGRAAGWRVVLGGPEPANYAAEYLEAGADVIAAGEGEIALELLLASGFAREAFLRIPGILFRDDRGEVVRTGPAQQIQNLDAQPWPDREKIDLNRYVETWRKHHGTGSLSVITARGCPYRCQWCSHSVYGMTHRRRSPAGVADEVEWLLARYRPDMLWMADDVFTIHPGWLQSYAAELKKRRIHIPFECITRADRVDETTAATLREIGCFRVWIGSESGSQRILDSMQRGVKTQQVKRAVELCKDRGIETGMFLMWGYEGEEIQDVEATVEHVRDTRPDIFFTTVSYPIGGTPYYEAVKDRLVSLKPWKEMTDRDYQIRGRHSRRFYQFADQLLRAETATVRDDAAIAAARAGLAESLSEMEVPVA